MRLIQKTLIGFSAALLACVGVQAVSPGNSMNRRDDIPATPGTSSQRFDGIAARNVFGLRPPVVETNAPQPEAPLPRVVLNGITTILANKKALLKVLPQPTKPGQPAKEEAFILGENQREGDIEVLKIDEHARTVKIDNSGRQMTLTFEQTTNSQPSTAYQPPPGGLGMIPNAVNRPLPRTLPSRFPRSALSAPGAPLPPGAQTSPASVPSATGYSTTGYPATGYVTPTPSANTTGAQQLTPEEQTFLNDVQNAVNNQNQPQPPRPAPGKQSLPPPPDNYLPKKVPLMPQ
jgi:hypothetical protein